MIKISERGHSNANTVSYYDIRAVTNAVSVTSYAACSEYSVPGAVHAVAAFTVLVAEIYIIRTSTVVQCPTL
jgi:hypothetical protein